MRKCMVIGSFDPVTVGHAELIRLAAELFDRTYAVIMHNSEKQYLFSGEQRLRLLELACGGRGEYGSQGKSGITCPQCGRFIPESIMDLLTQGHLRCPYCLLVIKIDRKK